MKSGADSYYSSTDDDHDYDDDGKGVIKYILKIMNTLIYMSLKKCISKFFLFYNFTEKFHTKRKSKKNLFVVIKEKSESRESLCLTPLQRPNTIEALKKELIHELEIQEGQACCQYNCYQPYYNYNYNQTGNQKFESNCMGICLPEFHNQSQQFQQQQLQQQPTCCEHINCGKLNQGFSCSCSTNPACYNYCRLYPIYVRKKDNCCQDSDIECPDNEQKHNRRSIKSHTTNIKKYVNNSEPIEEHQVNKNKRIKSGQQQKSCFNINRSNSLQELCSYCDEISSIPNLKKLNHRRIHFIEPENIDLLKYACRESTGRSLKQSFATINLHEE